MDTIGNEKALNNSESKANLNESNQTYAAEVLVLGESLFDMALEAESYPPAEGEKSEAYPIDELRAATQEFFSALRLLLGIEI